MEHPSVTADAIIDSTNLVSTIQYVTAAVAKLRAEMRLGNEWSADVVNAMTYSELLSTARRLREQLDNASAVREIIDKVAETIHMYNLPFVSSETPYPILQAAPKLQTINEQNLAASRAAWADFGARISSTRLVLKKIIAPRIGTLSSL